MTWSVSGATVRYGSVTALDQLSLTVDGGEVHAIIGGDGAGKTTLLQVLAGIRPPSSGSARLPERGRTGYVPSRGGVFGELTVSENLAFVARAQRLHGWEPSARSLLERATIATASDRLASRLSGGQQRKLAACMALLPRPALLILDEVTTGLDPMSRLELWRLVAGAAASGTAVVMATTYLDEAERAGWVTLLHRGQALASGTPEQVAAQAPGAVIDVAAPDGAAGVVWRHGRRWRHWDPSGPSGQLSLADAAIVHELIEEDQPRPGSTAESAPVGPAPAGGAAAGDAAVGPGDDHEDRGDAAPLLEVAAVSRLFGSVRAVDRVDLEVRRGEIVGLLGANGAGKTTLIKLILGLLAPSSGQVSAFGRGQDRRNRRRLGYVPQNLGLYADLTVGENLRFRSSVFDAPEPEVRADRDAIVGALPLGQQRRVAFAAATLHRPELLVLDEPTSGVSALERSRLWELIHTWADAGAAVLVSTHYTNEAEQADRLVILAQGRVVATGAAPTIVSGRRTVEVEAEHWEEAFRALDAEQRLVSLSGRTVRVLGGDAGAVAADLERAGVEAEVRSRPATLEEVLIELEISSATGSAAS